MKTLLMSIQEHVQKYVDMITTVFDVHVEVVDINKVRIAGTGRFNRMIGKPLYSGKVVSLAMTTGEAVFVKDPSIDPICQGCVNQAFCKDQCELVFPIKHKDEMMGSLALASSNREQYNTIIENADRLKLFMSNIVDLIALKAVEFQTQKIQRYNLELEEKLINLIHDGVMILNSSDEIIFMNKRCEKVLGCKLRQLPYLIKIKQFSVQKKTKKENDVAEYLIKIQNSQINLRGETRLIKGIEDDDMFTVFIFTDIKTLHQNIVTSEVREVHSFTNMVGQSEVFQMCVQQCREAALESSPTLLFGEGGTKKEDYARCMHNYSIRRNNQFIRLSHHSSIEKLIESIILDNEEFMQESNIRIKTELLHNSTIYINEVSNLTLGNQEVLLSIIEQSKYNNSKIICSTNKDLKSMTLNGNFNTNLYYLLEPFIIKVPSLRIRNNDTVLFIDYYLEKYNNRMNKSIKFSKDVYNLLTSYPWRGNIQEVDNIISYIVEQIHSPDCMLNTGDLPNVIVQRLQDNNDQSYNLENIEKAIILKALNDFGIGSHSKKRVAQELGISTATLYRKLKLYNILQNTSYD